MNRSSKAASSIVATCREAGITLSGRAVTGRALEDLSHKGLLLNDEQPGQVAERLRQLGLLGYGPGKSVQQVDHMTRVLLARSFPCEAAREAIFRRVVGADLDPTIFGGPLPHLTPGDARQAVREAFEDRSSFLWPVIERVSTCLVQGGRTDHAGAIIGPLEETAETRRDAWATALADGAFGQHVKDPTPLVDLLRLADGTQPLRALEDLSEAEEDLAHSVFGAVLPLAVAWVPALFASPLDELAGAAVRCRRLFQPLNLLARLAGQAAAPETLDDAAATFAPAMLLWDRKRPAWWPWAAPKGRPWWWPPKAPSTAAPAG